MATLFGRSAISFAQVWFPVGSIDRQEVSQACPVSGVLQVSPGGVAMEFSWTVRTSVWDRVGALRTLSRRSPLGRVCQPLRHLEVSTLELIRGRVVEMVWAMQLRNRDRPVGRQVCSMSSLRCASGLPQTLNVKQSPKCSMATRFRQSAISSTQVWSPVGSVESRNRTESPQE